jgi:hypothetical protein
MKLSFGAPRCGEPGIHDHRPFMITALAVIDPWLGRAGRPGMTSQGQRA